MAFVADKVKLTTPVPSPFGFCGEIPTIAAVTFKFAGVLISASGSSEFEPLQEINRKQFSTIIKLILERYFYLIKFLISVFDPFLM